MRTFPATIIIVVYGGSHC